MLRPLSSIASLPSRGQESSNTESSTTTLVDSHTTRCPTVTKTSPLAALSTLSIDTPGGTTKVHFQGDVNSAGDTCGPGTGVAAKAVVKAGRPKNAMINR